MLLASTADVTKAPRFLCLAAAITSMRARPRRRPRTSTASATSPPHRVLSPVTASRPPTRTAPTSTCPLRRPSAQGAIALGNLCSQAQAVW
ncbi:hypothetical protein [Pirellulimonas nuda]|uniref:hypothetical protein n=1 Tax=Pirellulimonas nuda TaxID=2528009 RepID=UPI001E574C1C|nr:hypothetical protein [Pirellulimonas nuda]